MSVIALLRPGSFLHPAEGEQGYHNRHEVNADLVDATEMSK
ncbi:MAG: hypothetical protein ACR2ME_01800 [Acidimicrobiia bacterium]